jgi:hypothetical protein
MASNKNREQTLVILLLDAYYKYISYGYPKDPAIYVVRASNKTLDKIETYLYNSDTIPKLIIDRSKSYLGFGDHGFKLLAADHLPMGKIEFGPEIIGLNWKGD